MLQIAADVGYSEIRVRRPRARTASYDVRYFSPARPRCRSAGTRRSPPRRARRARRRRPAAFHTQAGPSRSPRRARTAPSPRRSRASTPTSRTSPTTFSRPRCTRSAGRRRSRPGFPPRIAYAGARHLILAAATRDRLADLDYDFEAPQGDHARARADHRRPRLARGRRPPSTPATRSPSAASSRTRRPGAAAAAFGAYLRDPGLVTPPATVTVHQGVDMGRPSLLTIEIDAEAPEIRVSGRAVAM